LPKKREVKPMPIKEEGDFWEKPDDVSGIPHEIEIEGPDGKKITYTMSPKKDDFAQATKEDPEFVKPVHTSPCQICGEVHAAKGQPLCKCIKCRQFSRIVWCGQCVQCTHKRFSEMAEIGPEVADIIFADFAKWKKEQEHELAKENKMPWEK
jgi:hypothetical protein